MQHAKQLDNNTHIVDDFEAELLKMRDIERQSKFEATRLTQLLSEERNNNTKEVQH